MENVYRIELECKETDYKCFFIVRSTSEKEVKKLLDQQWLPIRGLGRLKDYKLFIVAVPVAAKILYFSEYEYE